MVRVLVRLFGFCYNESMSMEQSSSFTLSETVSQEEIDAIRERVARCTKSWEPSSTRLGTSYSIHGNMIVFWSHVDENGDACESFAKGSTMYLAKADTLQGLPIYEWETANHSIEPLRDLIKQEKWEVDDMSGAICRTYEPFQGESESDLLACCVRFH